MWISPNTTETFAARTEREESPTVAAPQTDGGIPRRRTVEPTGVSDVNRAGDLQLLDVEPELERGLTDAELAFTREHLVVPAWSLTPGRWTPGPEFAAALAVLLVDGLVLREADSPRGLDVQIYGPGDLLDPRLFADPEAVFSVLSGGDVALLGDSLIAVAGRCPNLIAPLTQRVFDVARDYHRLAVVRALSRVEERVYAFLADRADRWGKVTPTGLTLDLPITHETLGQLVGARRPTVSLALKQLDQERRLRRLTDGRWLIDQPERSAS